MKSFLILLVAASTFSALGIAQDAPSPAAPSQPSVTSPKPKGPSRSKSLEFEDEVIEGLGAQGDPMTAIIKDNSMESGHLYRKRPDWVQEVDQHVMDRSVEP